MQRTRQARQWPALALAALLGGAGVLHFLVPEPYEQLIPEALGSPRLWVYASGVAQLACAAGLAVPRTRRVTAWATAALFVAVFPGNVKMALDWSDRPPLQRAVAYGRLPLQVPLVLWAVAVARRSPRHPPVGDQDIPAVIRQFPTGG